MASLKQISDHADYVKSLRRRIEQRREAGLPSSLVLEQALDHAHTTLLELELDKELNPEGQE